jgi:hydrogenase expression/formation protein HypC
MCLAVPGKIIEIYETGGLKMAKLDYGGVVREACLAYVPEAQVGEYAIVHVGFALSILDEAEALKTLEAFEELDRLAQEEEAEGSA